MTNLFLNRLCALLVIAVSVGAVSIGCGDCSPTSALTGLVTASGDVETWHSYENGRWGFAVNFPAPVPAMAEDATQVELIASPPSAPGAVFTLRVNPLTYAQSKDLESVVAAALDRAVLAAEANRDGCKPTQTVAIDTAAGLSLECATKGKDGSPRTLQVQAVATPDRVIDVAVLRPDAWPAGATATNMFFESLRVSTGALPKSEPTLGELASEAYDAGRYKDVCPSLIADGFSDVICEWLAGCASGTGEGSFTADQLESFLRRHHVRRVSGTIVDWYDEANNEYEVRVAGRPAILVCTETTFGTRGRFTLWAQSNGTSDETLGSGRTITAQVYREWPLFLSIREVVAARAANRAALAQPLLGHLLESWSDSYRYVEPDPAADDATSP